MVCSCSAILRYVKKIQINRTLGLLYNLYGSNPASNGSLVCGLGFQFLFDCVGFLHLKENDRIGFASKTAAGSVSTSSNPASDHKHKLTNL